MCRFISRKSMVVVLAISFFLLSLTALTAEAKKPKERPGGNRVTFTGDLEGSDVVPGNLDAGITLVEFTCLDFVGSCFEGTGHAGLHYDGVLAVDRTERAGKGKWYASFIFHYNIDGMGHYTLYVDKGIWEQKKGVSTITFGGATGTIMDRERAERRSGQGSWTLPLRLVKNRV